MNQTTDELKGSQSGEISIANEVFELRYPAQDTYLFSKEARDARSGEAEAFRNVCVKVIDGLGVSETACIDAGANVGVTSLTLGALARDKKTGTPISRVFSFEPEPVTFACLKRNLEGFANIVTPFNTALGARAQKLPFIRTAGSTSASHLATESHFLGAGADFLQVERLDYYVDKLAVPHVGFIKIDVEGHEKSVLEGAIGTIEKFNPWIYLEFNSWTLIAYGGLNPRTFLDYLLGAFQQIFRVNKASGELEPIKHRNDAYAFLHNNLVIHGCVDDLVLRLK